MGWVERKMWRGKGGCKGKGGDLRERIKCAS